MERRHCTWSTAGTCFLIPLLLVICIFLPQTVGEHWFPNTTKEKTWLALATTAACQLPAIFWMFIASLVNVAGGCPRQ